jgi:hypothetical protein
MVAVAGVLPILSQILGEGSSVVIQPAWATVALAIAVALVALDRLSQDSIEHLLDLAKALTKKTDDLIQSETLQWVKEFRETLTEIERSATSESKR